MYTKHLQLAPLVALDMAVNAVLLFVTAILALVKIAHSIENDECLEEDTLFVGQF